MLARRPPEAAPAANRCSDNEIVRRPRAGSAALMRGPQRAEAARQRAAGPSCAPGKDANAPLRCLAAFQLGKCLHAAECAGKTLPLPANQTRYRIETAAQRKHTRTIARDAQIPSARGLTYEPWKALDPLIRNQEATGIAFLCGCRPGSRRGTQWRRFSGILPVCG